MIAKNKLEVGQTLYLVPIDMRWRKPGHVTVTKIGRKWAELGRSGRVNMDTMWMDGGDYSSDGFCYFSEEQYHAAKSADEAWSTLTNRLHIKGRPSVVTAEAIREAATLLGVDLT